MPYNTEKWIELARKVHGDKYDYSKVEYVKSTEKVCIICPIHGEFWQKASAHIEGECCPKCSHRSYKYTTEEFIELARKVHGDKYDYSKVEYKDAKTKICIICPVHGEFWQIPNSHLRGYGCKECSLLLKKFDTCKFIELARQVHGNNYDYSKVEYINSVTKICIICPVHGEFWQRPRDHINRKQGCPSCNNSHLENEIEALLDENKIDFIKQYRCDWLGKQSFDFFLLVKNIAIECQGRQHFYCEDYFGGKKAYEEVIERDKRKYKLCIDNGVKMLYYSNLHIAYPYEVYEDKIKLLKEINNSQNTQFK